MTYSPALAFLPAGVDSGQMAPSLIQARRSAISDSASLPWGGIFKRSWVWATAWTSKLFSASPGTTAGPDLPPLSSASRPLISRPPMRAVVWQAKQFFARTGRTRISKKSRWPATEVAADREEESRYSNGRVENARGITPLILLLGAPQHGMTARQGDKRASDHEEAARFCVIRNRDVAFNFLPEVAPAPAKTGAGELLQTRSLNLAADAPPALV